MTFEDLYRELELLIPARARWDLSVEVRTRPQPREGSHVRTEVEWSLYVSGMRDDSISLDARTPEGLLGQAKDALHTGIPGDIGEVKCLA